MKVKSKKSIAKSADQILVRVMQSLNDELKNLSGFIDEETVIEIKVTTKWKNGHPFVFRGSCQRAKKPVDSVKINDDPVENGLSR